MKRLLVVAAVAIAAAAFMPASAMAAADLCISVGGVVKIQSGTATCSSDATSRAVAFGAGSSAAAGHRKLRNGDRRQHRVASRGSTARAIDRSVASAIAAARRPRQTSRASADRNGTATAINGSTADASLGGQVTVINGVAR